jgi:hypothetical protein
LWNAMVLFTVISPFLYISLFCTPYTLIIYFLSLLYEFLVTTVLSCSFLFPIPVHHVFLRAFFLSDDFILV